MLQLEGRINNQILGVKELKLYAVEFCFMYDYLMISNIVEMGDILKMYIFLNFRFCCHAVMFFIG